MVGEHSTRGDEMPITSSQKSRTTWQENSHLWWPNSIPRVLCSPLNFIRTQDEVQSNMEDHPYISHGWTQTKTRHWTRTLARGLGHIARYSSYLVGEI